MLSLTLSTLFALTFDEVSRYKPVDRHVRESAKTRLIEQSLGTPLPKSIDWRVKKTPAEIQKLRLLKFTHRRLHP